MMKSPVQSGTRPRQLGVWSAASLVVGTVIGAGIFLVPSIMAGHLPSVTGIIAVWVVGGILSYFGALAYAELGAMFPATGGQYIFLRESFGPMVAFLCGWTFFLVVVPGTIAFLATGFASYFGSLIPLNGIESRAVAVALIGIFTVLNYRGLKPGILVQNTFTCLKLAGIVILIIAVFLSRSPSHLNFSLSTAGLSWREFGVALSAALVAYKGWANLSFINGEVREPSKNIPRALGLGVIAVGLVYILTTAAYMRVLPLSAIASSPRVGRDVAAVVMGSVGAIFVTVIILISILGSTNGNVLAAPRLYFAQAKDGLFFRSFARVHPRYETPYIAILVQGLWASVLALTGSYELVVTFSIFCAWVFYLFVVIGLMVLRRRNPSIERPYRMWGYPITPLMFAGVTVWFLINSLIMTPIPSVSGAVVLMCGIPVYWIWRRWYSVVATTSDCRTPETAKADDDEALNAASLETTAS